MTQRVQEHLANPALMLLVLAGAFMVLAAVVGLLLPVQA